MSGCCGRWRRDLLLVLAGVFVASAVLVPLAWSEVRVDRQRAEAELDALRKGLSEEREQTERELAARLEALRLRDLSENGAIKAFKDAAEPQP